MTEVKDLMTPDVVTAGLPGTREDVIEILQDGSISSIPVVNDGKYRGLISREELLRDPDEDQLAMLMREVVTIEPGAGVEECAELMLRERERRLPVVTDSAVEGIITLTDMIEYIAGLENDEDIEDYVDEGVLTVWRETPVNVAVEVIMLAGETAACVLDDSAGMAGIVTETDCVRASDVDTGSEKLGEGVANQDDDWMWEGIKSTSTQLIPVSRVTFPTDPVSEIMVDDVITVVRSTDVSHAAGLMTENRVHHLPLTRGDSLIGMVTDFDLLETLV